MTTQAGPRKLHYNISYRTPAAHRRHRIKVWAVRIGVVTSTAAVSSVITLMLAR